MDCRARARPAWRALAPGLGAPPGALHLRSDVLRKALSGVAEPTRLPPGTYTREASHRVTAELARRARAGLDAGRAVIADAVYAKPEERAAIEAVARELGAPFRGPWLEAPRETLPDRVTGRKDDASDATPEVVRRQLTYELGEITWRKPDASAECGATVAAAERFLSHPAAQATSA